MNTVTIDADTPPMPWSPLPAGKLPAMREEIATGEHPEFGKFQLARCIFSGALWVGLDAPTADATRYFSLPAAKVMESFFAYIEAQPDAAAPPPLPTLEWRGMAAYLDAALVAVAVSPTRGPVKIGTWHTDRAALRWSRCAPRQSANELLTEMRARRELVAIPDGTDLRPFVFHAADRSGTANGEST